MRQCLKLGYEDIAGERDGGIAAWREAGFADRRIGLVTPGELPASPVVDVRQAAEYRAGHIPGALPVVLGALAAASDLPAGPLTVTCGRAERP